MRLLLVPISALVVLTATGSAAIGDSAGRQSSRTGCAVPQPQLTRDQMAQFLEDGEGDRTQRHQQGRHQSRAPDPERRHTHS